MLAILRVDKLKYDSKPVAVLADAAFDHVADAQFFSDLPDIDSLALKVKEEVRATTTKSGNRESAVIMSSDSPSPK